MLAEVDGHDSQREAFRADVLKGLGQPQKSLPSRWLYDDRGSELFEAITQLDDYYLTRTETAILRRHAEDIAVFCGAEAVILEYGAGAGIKTEILLEALTEPRGYVPIDIAGAFLDQTAARVRQRFPSLTTTPIFADFTTEFALPARMPGGRRIAFFPGSTIGNLNQAEAARFLRQLRRQTGSSGGAIIGVDLEKDLSILIPAYDDRAGITAQFNLNLLARMNRELAASFPPAAFRHSVRWNAEESAIEMHLMSSVAQRVAVCGRSFDFLSGETIHTESSRKYAIGTFTRLAGESGWRAAHIWVDPENLFAVFGLT